MNVNDAISEVNTNIRPNPDKFSPLYREVVIALADEVERLRADLAAAKAASECPVKFDGVYVDSPKEVVVWFEEKGAAEPFADWLRQLKERGGQ